MGIALDSPRNRVPRDKDQSSTGQKFNKKERREREMKEKTAKG